jgi:hypothetical protein
MTYQHEAGELVVPDNVNVTALGNPVTDWGAWHAAVKEPLFPHEPKIEDIQQGQIGDCFLLASLVAIVSRPWGPDWILGMMKDLGTGRVAIRLYHEGAASYYTVEKSVVYTLKKGVTLHSTGPLWVQIVEKAYTAYAKGGTVPAAYAELDQGGHGNEALAVLLGGGSGSIPIDAGNDLLIRLFSVNPTSPEEEVLFFREALPKLIDRIMACNKQGTPVLVEWMDWVQTRKINTVRFEDAEPFFASRAAGYGASLKQDILEWLDTQRMLPGKRGTGRYSAAQIKVYEAILSRIANGQSVSVSTRDEVGRVDFFGHSAGEPVSKGLAGRHGYAVLGCRRDVETGLRWIKLRNPWGAVGRAYEPSAKHQGALSAVATKSGTFEIELSDFTKRFTNIYHGRRL